MTYATLPDMIARYGEKEIIDRTDRALPRLNAVDETVLNKALFDADAEIDGYLSVRYTLPLAAVPPDLKRIAGDIARFRLYDNKSVNEVRERYDDAVSWLTKVSTGKVRLRGLPTDAAPVVAAGRVEIISATRVLSRDTLRDY